MTKLQSTKKRDYRQYAYETTVIEAFEEWEEDRGVTLGIEWDDFYPWYDCFREGFKAGGNS